MLKLLSKQSLAGYVYDISDFSAVTWDYDLSNNLESTNKTSNLTFPALWERNLEMTH